ncbi:hypothetical protein L0Y34_00530, partial [Candidatus Parcubacteria bacterium]|nr:hypothetical protein [Candidatus Parcubacteria bacterium]
MDTPYAAETGRGALVWWALGSFVLVVLAGTFAWWQFAGREEQMKDTFTFRILENGAAYWYDLTPADRTVMLRARPSMMPLVPETLLESGDFSAVMTETGAVMTLSLQGLVSIDPDTGARTVLVAREGADYGSAALGFEGESVA